MAPPDTLERVRAEVDEVNCLMTPAAFHAVGQFFEDFSEVTDADVATALRRPAVAFGRGAIDRLLFGSTTQHLVRLASCPVLTLRKD